jgi:acetyl esterase
MDDVERKYQSLKDPGIRAFMIAGERFYPANAVNFTTAEQRAFYDRYCAHFRKARPAGVAVSDEKIAGVPCRRYAPSQTGDAILLYLHGGGYVLGGLDSHDDVCAEIADRAGVHVVGVQYRLAPEHSFPAALDDCFAVASVLAKKTGRLLVGGDSAGGNLTSAVSLKARDEGGPAIAGNILIYPGLGGDMTKGSYVSQANAPGLTLKDVLYYRDVYKGGGSKYAEPLRETDYGRLPPAFVISAALDPLHDDGAEWVMRLQAAGIPARFRSEPLLVHAFLRARHMSAPARDAFTAIVEATRSLANSGTLPA